MNNVCSISYFLAAFAVNHLFTFPLGSYINYREVMRNNAQLCPGGMMNLEMVCRHEDNSS